MTPLKRRLKKVFGIAFIFVIYLNIFSEKASVNNYFFN